MSLTSTAENLLSKESRLQYEREKKMKEFQQQIRELSLEIETGRVRVKALKNLEENSVQPEHHPKIRKPFEQISSEVRALVVQKYYYEQSMNEKEVKQTYNISHSSLHRFVKSEKRKVNGEPQLPKKKRGRKSPLTEEILCFIMYELELNCKLKLKDIVEKVETSFTISTSETAIHEALKKMKITWKKALAIPAIWNSTTVLEARRKYLVDYGLIHYRFLVYVDETGFNLERKPSKGRALSGERACVSVLPKSKNLTMIAALSITGIPYHSFINSTKDKKGTDAKDFRSFMFDLVAKIPQGSVVILDNAKIHHANLLNDFWQMIKTSKGIDILFLPPYSPFINPIEYWFHSLKQEVETVNPQEIDDLKKCITNFLPKVSADNAKSYFDHAASYYAQIAAGLPFRGKPLNPFTDLTEETSMQTTQQMISN